VTRFERGKAPRAYLQGLHLVGSEFWLVDSVFGDFWEKMILLRYSFCEKNKWFCVLWFVSVRDNDYTAKPVLWLCHIWQWDQKALARPSLVLLCELHVFIYEELRVVDISVFNSPSFDDWPHTMSLWYGVQPFRKKNQPNRELDFQKRPMGIRKTNPYKK
jgi:hypothetical protein